MNARADPPAHFRRFAAIDWSGARGQRHRGIAVAVAQAGDAAPVPVPPPGGCWSRQAVLDWVLLHADAPMLIGFDFSFSAPFLDRAAHLPGEPFTEDAPALWRWVDRNSTDADLGAAGFVDARRGLHVYGGAADGQKAQFLRYRRCETAIAATGRSRPSSIFDAVGAAQVAKASFAGMRLLDRLRGIVPVWPIDPIPAAGALIVEIYPALAVRAAGLGRGKLRSAAVLDQALAAMGSAPHAPLARYDDHSTDALLTAAWLRANAARPPLWSPAGLTREIAQTEGWIFGVE
ncbi:DUF429 domain-containing protein [uncultured Sphingomonas sp.]|uniref:DUF429 domain-containing protein n=1 Tax=uncultured Sphingomonas sp. TaxID=158754 RepID=UPI0026248EC3|nr:DUF429 domain-containing protein [uncultured Sphingomonas sp.]